MKVKHIIDNGNVAAVQRQQLSSRNYDNNSWVIVDNTDSRNIFNNTITIDNSQFNSNYTVYDSRESDRIESINSTIDYKESDVISEQICNIQYRLNEQNNLNLFSSCNQSSNLERATEAVFGSSESFLGDSNALSNTSPVFEERAYEKTDTDEMSEISQHVPRGIVNPNYPGFQHLAHTLQDYSSNIENFYQSENEMTDDDIDLEISESNNEIVVAPNENDVQPIDYKSFNNNNNTLIENNIEFSQSDITQQKLANQLQNEVPDLLKTISVKNNNGNTITALSQSDITYTNTDIENNFHTKDIIGDFNKEVEDEIKQLLNYNINIENDLEELRKDIQNTFAKPIENTINNISEVVNHVIKKLVETQNEPVENNESKSKVRQRDGIEEVNDVNIDNIINTKTEMSRPSFLLIEGNSDSITADAFLSDGKDKIKIYDDHFDTAALSNNVENTIQQLSTELRKIIPKLDEMRKQDKLWNGPEKVSCSLKMDGNSNEVLRTSKNVTVSTNVNRINGSKVTSPIDNSTGKSTIGALVSNTKILWEKSHETVSRSYRSAQLRSSVRKNESPKDLDVGSFEVYNIETALPKLDIDAIESHLKAAKEAERRKRNDREEIRKRLAMGIDTDEYYSLGHFDRPWKKPSLHSRLQSGKNLQICFMNEIASDYESQASDVEKSPNTQSLSQSSIVSNSFNHPYQTKPLSVNITKHDKLSSLQSGLKIRPPSISVKTPKSRSAHSLGHIELRESDFYALQATLQTEARIALAQAKEMARLQMERERRGRAVSPVTEMLRRSMEKANAPLAADRRRVSRQILTDMNIAQLQVIVNELHSQIESLNDSLVKYLMQRDELHMGQDSMLVDIEDLTRYLGVKEQTKKVKGSKGVRRLTSLVNK